MFDQVPDGGARLEVPEAHDPVEAARHRPPAVGESGHPSLSGRVPEQADLAAALDVPEDHGPVTIVGGGRQQPLAIRQDADRLEPGVQMPHDMCRLDVGLGRRRRRHHGLLPGDIRGLGPATSRGGGGSGRDSGGAGRASSTASTAFARLVDPETRSRAPERFDHGEQHSQDGSQQERDSRRQVPVSAEVADVHRWLFSRMKTSRSDKRMAEPAGRDARSAPVSAHTPP